MRFDYVQGDLDPPLTITLEGAGAIPAGSTVVFSMAEAGGAVVLSAPAVVSDAVKRLATYQWAAGDTDVPGVYRARMTLTGPDGRPETTPSAEPMFIVIHPSL